MNAKHILILFLAAASASASESVTELLRRLDTNDDGRLSKEEFAKGLEDNEVRKAIPARVQSAASLPAAVTELFDERYADLPRYELRRLRANAILLKRDPKVRAFVREALSPFVPGTGISTYDAFLVNRAYGDQRFRELAFAAKRPLSEPAETSGFISFFEQNFRIRNDAAEIDADASLDTPARFSWTKPRGEDAYYSVDAAVLFTPDWLDHKWIETDKLFTGQVEVSPALQGRWLNAWRVRPLFEAHISTQADANQNNLTYAVPFQFRSKWFPGIREVQEDSTELWRNAPFFTAHAFDAELKYVTDRSASVRTWGVDAGYQPAVARFNLNDGNPIPVPGIEWLEYSFSGEANFALRAYDEQGASAGLDDYAELNGFFEATIVLAKRLTLRGKYTGALNLWGDPPDHDLLELHAELLLDERNHFSIGASYLMGEAEPTFVQVDSITGWVGVKF